MKFINTDKAPQPVGPYSQATDVGGRLFTSGQIPVVPETGELAAGGVDAQARQAMENLREVLQAAGSDMKYITKIVLFVKSLDNLDIINEVYSKYFDCVYPARTCVEVSRLPKDAELEIEAVAFVP